MVGQQSLQDVLNFVASGVADGTFAPENFKSSKRTNGSHSNSTTFTELDAYLSLDPLLADLHKRYLNAKVQNLQSAREYGADSPMSEMALWNEESSFSAVQTRLMELRSHKTSSDGAASLLLQKQEEERAKEQRAREKESVKTFEQMQMIARMHETKSQSSNTAWWMLYCLMAMTPEKPFRFYMPSHQFNRLAAA